MKVSYFLPLIMLLLISSCTEEFDEPLIIEDEIMIEAPVFIETSLFIEVTDFVSNEEIDATCIINDIEYKPDANGLLYIPSILMNKEGQLVKVKSDGFMPAIFSVIPSIGDVTQLKVRILESRPIVTFDALEGGSFIISDSEYSIPALSIVDGNGDDYLGAVDVRNYNRQSALYVTLITAFSHNILIEDGKNYSMQTWGGQDLFLYDVNGNEVFVGEGVKIQVRLDIESVENNIIPDELDIMRFNELTNKWELDSEAKLEGEIHIAEISGFGHLRWSKSIEVRRAKVKFNSESGPLASVTALVYLNESNPISISSTNDKGDAYVYVPVSGSYSINTFFYCGSFPLIENVYEEAVGNEDEVLILKDFESTVSVVSIEGRIVDCNGNAVPYGLYRRREITDYYFIADENGIFSSQYYTCDPIESGGSVYDPITQVFSDGLNFDPIQGMTVNIGNVAACQ